MLNKLNFTQKQISEHIFLYEIYYCISRTVVNYAIYFPMKGISLIRIEVEYDKTNTAANSKNTPIKVLSNDSVSTPTTLLISSKKNGCTKYTPKLYLERNLIIVSIKTGVLLSCFFS